MALHFDPDYDMLIKLLLIGDSGVGKTCLLLRYCDDSFSPTFITTIGIDFKVKTLEIEGKRIKLQIWDTAGQERFRTITTAYYRGAMGIILVYDITSDESFASLGNWIHHIERHAPPSVNRMLIGNKCDMDDLRVVEHERGKNLASQYSLDFYETSAKSGKGVEEAFQCLATRIMKRLEERPSSSQTGGNGGTSTSTTTSQPSSSSSSSHHHQSLVDPTQESTGGKKGCPC